MGWCPHAQDLRFRRSAAPDPAALAVPAVSGGSGSPAAAFGSLNRYRTRALLFALCMTGVGASLLATATGDRIVLLTLGVVLATILYAGDALRYREVFSTVERTGVADEKDWKEISVVRLLPVIGVALILGFVGVVLLGLVPGLSMLAVNGFLAGFGIIGWYHLAVVMVWEQRSGIALYTDGNRIYRRA